MDSAKFPRRVFGGGGTSARDAARMSNAGNYTLEMATRSR